MSDIKFIVPAISCGHCVHTIKMELSELAGVKKVEGDPATKEINVSYEFPATPEAIEKLLVDINYPPQK